MESSSRPPEVFTIGHSRCAFADILALLKTFRIQMLVDIRARSHVSFFPEFSKKNIKMTLVQSGIVYVFLGDSLGLAKDPRGRNKRNFDRIQLESTAEFKEGIEWVMDQARYARICLFAGEADPFICHRHYLVGQNLLARGARVNHILLDGTLVQAGPDLFHRPG